MWCRLSTLLATTMFMCLQPNRAAESREAVAGPIDPAARAVNALGVELLRKSAAPDANWLLSPYSVQLALAMTYAGAEGVTREEMARALQYPADDAVLHGSFAALSAALKEIETSSAPVGKRARQRDREMETLELNIANRLFGEKSFQFRPDYLAMLSERYGASLVPLDFKHDPAAAAWNINQWVAEQTHQRIPEILPPMGVGSDTRLALINAVYFKAAWEKTFSTAATHSEPFHVRGGAPKDVPTMVLQRSFGFARGDGFRAITLPYSDRRLQFLILLPDAVDGWKALELKLTRELLRANAEPAAERILLHLPKFRLEPPVLALGSALQDLGVKSAFDLPTGSANFDRMAPRRADDYLRISKVFHRTFLNLDENGTEAAAATAVMIEATAAPVSPPKPVEVKVDRPFLFAIQHRPSGTCLFLGRLTDPR